MSTIKVQNVQLGDGAPNVNFTFKVPGTPDGTMKLMRGIDSAPLQDLLTVDASNNLYLPTGTAPTKLSSDKSTAIATTAHVYNHRGTAKAFCVFRPSTASILMQHNISSITRHSAGVYQIFMNTANINSGSGFTFSTSYTVVGNAGSDEVGNFIAGQNNILHTGVRGPSNFYVYAWDAGNSANEDPGIISIMVFGV